MINDASAMTINSKETKAAFDRKVDEIGRLWNSLPYKAKNLVTNYNTYKSVLKDKRNNYEWKIIPAVEGHYKNYDEIYIYWIRVRDPETQEVKEIEYTEAEIEKYKYDFNNLPGVIGNGTRTKYVGKDWVDTVPEHGELVHIQ